MKQAAPPAFRILPTVEVANWPFLSCGILRKPDGEIDYGQALVKLALQPPDERSGETKMRVLFAGLFVCIGLGLFVALIGAVLEHVSPLWRGPIGIGIAMVALLLIAAALVLFNSFTRSSNSTPTASDDESAAQLERDNLLSSTRFQATRAFQVPEFEDEGPHYFIELVGGAVLYLNGQYLHDYEPDEFTSETTGSETDAEPRTEFPCTDFTVRRHRVEGYVVDIQCAGSGLQPTPIERDFFQADGYANDYPTDGDVITDTSYDELRARFAART